MVEWLGGSAGYLQPPLPQALSVPLKDGRVPAGGFLRGVPKASHREAEKEKS